MWKKVPIKEAIYASFAINLTSIVLIFVVKSFLPPIVPLFYGLPSGNEQLSPALGLLILPVSGLVISLINMLIAGGINDIFLKKALVISGTFVSILSAITVVKIILLVGFF